MYLYNGCRTLNRTRRSCSLRGESYVISVHLIHAEKETDKEFMKRLYLDYYAKMLRMAYSMTSNQSDAEDIIHDACLSLIPKVPLLKTLPTEIQEGYVISTTKNAAFKVLRKQNRTVSIENDHMNQIPDDQPSTDYALLEEASIQELMDAIRELSAEDQLVLRMKYFEKSTDTEIGKLLEIKEVSVRSKLTRARQRIQRILEERQNGE